LEVYYGFYRDAGSDAATEMLGDVNAAEIEIIGAENDRRIFLEAGRLKASYKMSLADAIFLATAQVDNLIALTADHHEFDAVELREKSIRFEWIR
jgi:predicted nucleic acid-binding protein